MGDRVDDATVLQWKEPGDGQSQFAERSIASRRDMRARKGPSDGRSRFAEEHHRGATYASK
jgi:hypothetical protein